MGVSSVIPTCTMSSLAPTTTDTELSSTLTQTMPTTDNVPMVPLMSSTSGVTTQTAKTVPSPLVTMLMPSLIPLVTLTTTTTQLTDHTHGMQPALKTCQVISTVTRMTGDSHFEWVVVSMSLLDGLMMPPHSPRVVVLPTLAIMLSSQTFSPINHLKTVQLLAHILPMSLGPCIQCSHFPTQTNRLH